MGNVKVYRSTDNGAPILYGNAGYLIPVLDACLINGYGVQTPTSVTRNSSGLVTCVLPALHNLKSFSRQTIAGVNEAGFNGEYIVTVTDGYTFTYQGSGGVATATGTITSKTAGAGWTKPFSSTNLAAYRGGSGNQNYLRVDDSTTLSVRAVGYEDMTGISVGTNLFPTAAQFAGGLYIQKSATADATIARDWVIVADDRTFYLWVNWNGSGTNVDTPMVMFGEFQSDKIGDIWNTMISCNTLGATAVNYRFGYLTATVQAVETGMYLARSYSQLGTSILGSKVSDYTKSNGQASMGSTPGLIYPHQVNGSLCLAPVWVCENAPVAAQSVVRGTMRGVWNPLHLKPLANGDTFVGTGELDGKIFLAFAIQPTGMVMIDISMTW